ncbi:MAG: MetS family NSS transporter small subunit [Candidatus Zixiibacteriota bacterium]
MPASAIIMLIFTSLVLFGGIGICLYIVFKKK